VLFFARCVFGVLCAPLSIDLAFYYHKSFKSHRYHDIIMCGAVRLRGGL
jgi:hypothetical protein